MADNPRGEVKLTVADKQYTLKAIPVRVLAIEERIGSLVKFARNLSDMDIRYGDIIAIIEEGAAVPAADRDDVRSDILRRGYTNLIVDIEQFLAYCLGGEGNREARESSEGNGKAGQT